MASDLTDVVRALREQISALQTGPGGGPIADSQTMRSGPDQTPGVGSDALGSAATDQLTDDAPPGAAPPGAAPRDSAPAGSSGTAEERSAETQAKNICLRLLADAARPRADLAAKLARRGIDPLIAERVLDRLTEVGLLDDQAYAEAYVRTKHQERALSRRALTAELRRKGVDDAVVARAAEAVDPDAEETAATRLVAKRAPAALAAGQDAARRRLLALLDRRGYPADLSIRVVDGVLGHRDE